MKEGFNILQKLGGAQSAAKKSEKQFEMFKIPDFKPKPTDTMKAYSFQRSKSSGTNIMGPRKIERKKEEEKKQELEPKIYINKDQPIIKEESETSESPHTPLIPAFRKNSSSGKEKSPRKKNVMEMRKVYSK